MKILLILTLLIVSISTFCQQTINRSACAYKDSLWTVPLAYVHPLTITEDTITVYEDKYILHSKEEKVDESGRKYTYYVSNDTKGKKCIIRLYNTLLFIFYDRFAVCYTISF